MLYQLKSYWLSVENYQCLNKVLGGRDKYLDLTQCLEIDVSCRDGIRAIRLRNFTFY